MFKPSFLSLILNNQQPFSLCISLSCNILHYLDFVPHNPKFSLSSYQIPFKWYIYNVDSRLQVQPTHLLPFLETCRP